VIAPLQALSQLGLPVWPSPGKGDVLMDPDGHVNAANANQMHVMLDMFVNATSSNLTI